MDTSKYRLPDFVNGNGTKAHPDTKLEHLERSTPLSPSSLSSLSPPPPPPPPPPPKDTPPLRSHARSSSSPSPSPSSSPSLSQSRSPEPPSYFVPGEASYFTPGHHRPGSIYTLSRASFASQLEQLTSLGLPNADSLAARVSALPTAQAAARALIAAADQIKSWTGKAAEVIDGLDSDDDVEWAAAGGREGLAEVEGAITRFEGLINAYVGAFEELQGRPDIADVAASDLQRAIAQMDAVVGEWSTIRAALQAVKNQVELAMEWEELWNVVLGDIQNEKDDLVRLIFEMEERRHQTLLHAASMSTSSDATTSIDVDDMELMTDRLSLRAPTTTTTTTTTTATSSFSSVSPPLQPQHLQQNRRSSARFSLPPLLSSPGPASPSTPTMSQRPDDSSLLALFARMQPLRASLDFLPMRLSVFEARAQHIFPTACDELEDRRAALDADYEKLERDAEALRKELGEDRWVLVFRGAGRQAQKMCESVERAVARLQHAVAARLDLTNQPLIAKHIEGYDAKKTHYAPAIERIVGIIDRGVKDRLTVNGEILRLHREVQARWIGLQDQMRDADVILEELQAGTATTAAGSATAPSIATTATRASLKNPRDSFSSMFSVDRCTVASGNDTPGSSPPSSVIITNGGPVTPKPKTPGRVRPGLYAGAGAGATENSPRTTSGSYSKINNRPSTLPSKIPHRPSQQKQTPSSSSSSSSSREPWRNYITNPNNKMFGRMSPNIATTKLPTPSSARTTRAATPATPASTVSSSFDSPSIEDPLLSSPDPKPETTPSRRSVSSRGGPSQRTPPLSKIRLTASNVSTRLAPSGVSPATSSNSVNNDGEDDSPTAPGRRSASSLSYITGGGSSSRRNSMLPQPKPGPPAAAINGPNNPALAGALCAMRQSSNSASTQKPRWRH